MHRPLKKLALVAATALPAAAMIVGTAAAVSPYSKVKNGGFDTNTAFWATTANPTAKITQGYGVAKVANTTNSAAATYASAYQCFPLAGNYKYELSGKVQVLKNQKRTGSARMAIAFYSDDGCGDKLGAAYTLPVTDVGVWKQQSLTPSAPKETKSAKVFLQVNKDDTNLKADTGLEFSAYFDEVQVLQKSIKIPNGPIIIVNPAPQPNPDPQDPPQQPDPNPNPNPNPQPQPNPQPVPADDPMPAADETVEETVPGPEIPDEPISEPASGQPEGDHAATDTSTPAEQPAAGGEATGKDVQSLGQSDSGNGGGQEQPKRQSTTSNPTPAAPETGNAATAAEGLLGPTELGIIGGAALAGIGLAFVAGARSRRRPAYEDDDYLR